MLDAFEDIDDALDEEFTRKEARQNSGHGCPPLPPLPAADVADAGIFVADEEGGWVDLTGTAIGLRFRVLLIGLHTVLFVRYRSTLRRTVQYAVPYSR